MWIEYIVNHNDWLSYHECLRISVDDSLNCIEDSQSIGKETLVMQQRGMIFTVILLLRCLPHSHSARPGIIFRGRAIACFFVTPRSSPMDAAHSTMRCLAQILMRIGILEVGRMAKGKDMALGYLPIETSTLSFDTNQNLVNHRCVTTSWIDLNSYHHNSWSSALCPLAWCWFGDNSYQQWDVQFKASVFNRLGENTICSHQGSKKRARSVVNLAKGGYDDEWVIRCIGQEDVDGVANDAWTTTEFNVTDSCYFISLDVCADDLNEFLQRVHQWISWRKWSLSADIFGHSSKLMNVSVRFYFYRHHSL